MFNENPHPHDKYRLIKLVQPMVLVASIVTVAFVLGLILGYIL